MNLFRNLSTTTALVTLITTSGACADITGTQVWNDYKSYMDGFGYDVSSVDIVSGNDITVKNLTIIMPLPNDTGTMTMIYGQMSFTTNSDGTASVTIPNNMPFDIVVRPKNGENIDVKLNYKHSGLSVVASGSVEDVNYAFNADTLGMELIKLVIDGETVDIGAADLTMTNITGNIMMAANNIRKINEIGKIEEITYNIAIKNPKGEGHFNLKGNLKNVGFDAEITMPLMMDANNMVAMMTAGFSVKGAFWHNGATSSFNFVDQGNTMTTNSTTTSGSLNMDMSETHIQYGGVANNVAFDMTNSGLPVPISMEMATAAFDIKIPVAKSEEEQDFSFMIKLGDFTVSDMLWGLIDATGQLPRDPATILLDLSGKAKMLFNLLDPTQAAKMGDQKLGEINALALNSLVVSAAGATLTGNGAFTFDNSDLETFGGIPAPTGSVDIKLEGGNGLLDKLVAIGLLPEDQAMGARMMVGMFSVTAGEDILTSKIEITGDGGISANGMRIK